VQKKANLTCLLVLLTVAFGQNTAVMIKEFSAKNVPSGDVEAVTEIFKNALLGTKAFRVIERGDELKAILKESALQQTGITEEKYAVTLGRIVNVNFMFAGSLSKLGDQYVLGVRLVNVENAEIVDSWDTSSGNLGELAKGTKELARRAGSNSAVAGVNLMPMSKFISETLSKKDEMIVIDLNDMKVTDSDAIAAIPSPEKVKILRLKNSLVTDVFLQTTLVKMTNLTELVLRNNSKVSESGLLLGLSKITKLIRLNLTMVQSVSDKVIIEIAKRNSSLAFLDFAATATTDLSLINGLTHLRELKEITRWHPGDGSSSKFQFSCEGIIPVLKSNRGVSLLWLERNNIGDCLVDYLINSDYKSLRKLVLTGNPISEMKLEPLKKQFPELIVVMTRYLLLSGDKYDDNYIKTNVSNWINVERIDFTSTKVSDEGIILACKSMPRLGYIGIIDSPIITDRTLLEGICKMNATPYVYLDKCKSISDSGILLFLKEIKQLHGLNITKMSISKEVISEIKKKFPTISLTY